MPFRAVLIVAALVMATILAATGAPRRTADLLVRAWMRVALEHLVASLDRGERPAARFSALRVTGTHAALRGSAPVRLAVRANVARVITIASRSSSADALAATAAAMVVGGDEAQAVEILETATRTFGDDARLWSDLAAANLETDRLLRALVAADRALRIEPQLVEALYNRGLALERLGLAVVAAEAWRQCLNAGPPGELMAVIRERLRKIEATPSEATRWRPAEKDLYRAAAAGDAAAVDRIASEFPRRLRAWAEMYCLARWADALRAGEAANAVESLRVARAAGAALARHDETLVADAVAAIDDAIVRRDVDRLDRLAAGHQAFFRARKAYSVRNNPTAEREMRAAAGAFAGTGSPMHSVAQRWVASILIDFVAIDRAAEILEPVLETEQHTNHRALVADVEYLLGICEAARGRWNDAVEYARRSARLRRELGETENAALAENLVAEVLDAVGQWDLGWTARIKAFHETSASGAMNRLWVSVAGGTRAAMRAHDRELALSLLDIELTLASLAEDPMLSAEMHTRRALVQHERREAEDRDRSLARGRIAAAVVAAEAEREWRRVELDSAAAVIVRERNPWRAIELLSHAVTFCEATNRRLYLPEVLLQRGRTYLTAGDDAAAARDFAAGIDEVEAQRSAIPNLELRARVFDASEGLFDEAVGLEVRRGNAEAAFALAERARGRALLDLVGGAARPVASSQDVARRLDDETLLLEFAVLPERVVTFAIRGGTMRMAAVDMKPEEVPARVDMLLRAVRDELATSANVIIVPDKVLQRVSFAQHLVKTHSVSVTPSASLLVARETVLPKERSVLIVANPAPDPDLELEALPAVEREMESLRAIYRPARVLVGPDATKARFVAEAPKYDVVHFGGHGVSDEESLTASLLLARSGSDSGRMDAADIARMRLSRAPLVVLGACGTLRGRATGVEGMPSLARSFLAAGASSVVGTLWDVGDEEARTLLTSFHRHSAAGDAPPEALRKAQLEAIARGGDDALPKNWAAFVVYAATR